MQFTGQNLLIDFNPGQSLNSHIITGDGRANENIGLTAVHHVFHEEHNALVANIQTSILATGEAAFIAQWQTSPGVWDGEKLYQAARLVTESEYNHIAIDQYVGTLYGALPEFVSYSSDINMGVSLEFSQAVFRLGHSMLTETFNVTDPNTGQDLKLLDMFLNPALYQEIGPTALAQGLTTTLGNEVDEFVTPALQQSLLGQPIDLATINIARGRDVGLPTWNEFRQQVYDQLIQNTNNTNGSALAPYTNWADVGDHLKSTGTLVNMIAAYAHDTGAFDWGIDEARAAYEAGTATLADIRAAAQALYDAYLDPLSGNHAAAIEFMQGAPTYDPVTAQWTFAGADQGFWDIDLWIGGLAERPLFDGPLGTTFSYVILDFAQRQQDGDRFYYLFRTPMGTHLGNEIIENQFGNLVMDHTGLDHLNGEIFIWANETYTLTDGPDYFNVANEMILDVDGTPMPASAGHLIIAGLGGDDYLVAGLGDDTIYGDAGNDQLYGSQGNDHLFGGDGNDYIFDDENDDFITGGAGNDRVFAGPGAIDTVFGDEGDDEIHGGDGIDELLGGTGDDMIYGDGDTDVLFGEEGNDYLEGGDSVDEMQGQEGNDWMRGGVGDDHLMGGDGNDLLEGGVGPTANDGDRMLGQGVLDFSLITPPDLGFDVVSYEDVDIAITANLDTSNENGTGGLLDTYAGIEGLVGTRFNDNLTGADTDTTTSNGFDNLLVGGAGNDILTGLGGDDIIMGDSAVVKNDLSVFFGPQVGNYVTVTNWKGTGEDRPDFGALGGLGHFLGDNGEAGTADKAVFSGNFADYVITPEPSKGPTAFRIVDTRGIDSTAVGDLVIDIESLVFADQTISLIPPVLDLHAFDSGNYRDQFGSSSYSNSNGTVLWTSSWTETGDVTTGNIVTGGQIRIAGNELVFGDNDNDTGLGNATIQRTVDLSGVGAGTARLSFNYDENNFDASEIVTVSFAADGINFVTLQTIDSSSGEGTSDIPLTGPFTANAVVRFVVSGTNNNSGSDNVQIDNVNIAFTTPVVDGNNYATTFTENGAVLPIASNPGITTGGTQMYSAKIVLTNAQAGDVMSIAGGLGGISSSIDTSVAGKITVNLTGVASVEAYQAAIQAVRYSNTSDNPSPTARIIEVTVNNGFHDSNVATSTVTVVPVDDAVNANNDRLVTNYVDGQAFAVLESAFLANDVDPDNVLDVTAVSGASGLTASLLTNPGSITITDTAGTPGGSFNYTATGGPATDTASVAVVRDTSGSIDGNNGNDIIVGNGDSSTIDGNQGNDIIFAGAGNDTIIYSMGDGADTIDGGAHVTADILNISGSGGGGNDTLDVIYNGGALIAGFEGGTVTGVETINANLNGGTDTLSYAGSTWGVTVNLATPSASGFSSISNIENVTGGDGGDTLTGGTGVNILNGGGGSDTLNGGADNDELSGGAGADVMFGGAGNDDFNFDDGDTGVGAGVRDIILDFLGGGGAEDIDLSAIDANTTVDGGGGGGQTFSFIGTAAFSDSNASATLAAGQVRFDLIDTNADSVLDSTLVQGNVNNDLAADFEILLKNFTGPLGATDFIL